MLDNMMKGAQAQNQHLSQALEQAKLESKRKLVHAKEKLAVRSQPRPKTCKLETITLLRAALREDQRRDLDASAG